MSGDFNDGTNFPYKTKFSEPQLSKMMQSWGN